MKKKKEVKQMIENDVVILAKTIYGEARGECEQGQIAVACSVVNRFKSRRWFAGDTIASTCLKPFQYSCWNKNDPNYTILSTMLEDDERLKPFIKIAEKVINNNIKDIIDGCTHYYVKGTKEPEWAKGQIPHLQIDSHLFYKNIY